MMFLDTERLNYTIKSSNCLIIVFYFKRVIVKMTKLSSKAILYKHFEYTNMFS